MAMSTETTNYARHRKTGELVFFGAKCPEVVRARPEDWASWHPTTVDSVHRIGEGASAHCARNGHRPRRCVACSEVERQGVAL
jgi:hypothetical protein